MRFGVFSIITLFSVLLGKAYGLVPLESLLLGDFSQNYEEQVDPIGHIFHLKSQRYQTAPQIYREQVALYRGFYEEGKNLQNLCLENPKVEYANSWDEKQVLRTVAATLQYLGLDLTVRAIPQYAKYFEFTEQEYRNLVNNLIGNYCSQNLTVISKKQLEKNMLVKFQKENTFKLPSVKDNPLFAPGLEAIGTIDEIKEREFYQSLNLFRAFCSWGGDSEDFRLLTPLLNNPAIMGHIVRQLTQKKIVWEAGDNNLFKEKDNQSLQIRCQNLICRKTDALDFVNHFPRSLGSRGIGDDLNRLYCHDIRKRSFKFREQVPQIKKIMDQMTFDEQNLMVGQFIALTTGVPDFFVGAKKFTDGQDFLRASLDHTWDEWARKRSEHFNKDLYYEEPMTIELVDRNLSFNRYRKNFNVVFDVNLGEFDRINQKVGKTTVSFEVKLSKKFLNWIRLQWINADPREEGVKKEILGSIEKRIGPQIKEAFDKLSRPPWKDELSSLIGMELLEQLAEVKGVLYKENEGLIHIPIAFNYGPFALRYIREQYLIEQEKNRSLKPLGPNVAGRP